MQGIELVAGRHLALHRAGVLTRQLGFRRIAHGGALDQPDVVAHQILGLHRDGQRHHGVLGQPVEQGEHMIPGGAFCRHVADVRRPPEPLHRDEGVRQPIEPPGG